MAPLLDPPPSPPQPASTPSPPSQPRPRPPRSPGHLERVRVQNRRRAYLERHGETYFGLAEHELAAPLLYDTLIRRFQSPAEREADGRAKGYARVLEGSLVRGEARLAQLRAETVGRNSSPSSTSHPSRVPPSTSVGLGAGAGVVGSTIAAAFGATTSNPSTPTNGTTTTTPTTDFTTLTTTDFTTSLTPPPTTPAEGLSQWRTFLRERFVRGEDDGFDGYERVDADEEWDVLEREERSEAWFEAEEPAWVSSGDGGEGEVLGDGVGKKKGEGEDGSAASVTEGLDGETKLALPPLPYKDTARLEKHIRTLYALVETESLSMENTDEAVDDFDDRLRRAQGRVKVIERMVGEGEKEKAGAKGEAGGDGGGHDPGSGSGGLEV